MRSRSNSGVRLDGYARLVQETILCHQVSLNLAQLFREKLIMKESPLHPNLSTTLLTLLLCAAVDYKLTVVWLCFSLCI